MTVTLKTPVDGTQKIADLIDMMLLEFKSLSDGDDDAPLSAMRESDEWIEDDGESASGPLGSLADELEGPDPEPAAPTPEAPGVTGWFKGLIRT